jgi:hypothetical protein
MARVITNFGNERFEGTSEEFREVLKTKLAAPDQMKSFKVITKWTGYSEITVQAKNEEQAKLLVEEGEYDTDNEVLTGNGLDYGYNDEETIDIQEIEENEDE